MKEKIRNLFDEMKVRSRYKSMSDIINMIEPIVNQEVEKRIAETVAGKFIAVEIEKRIKERMPSEEEWIDIKDRMPESGQCVLIYSHSGGVAEGAWLSSKNHFEQWRWSAVLNDVTHWFIDVFLNNSEKYHNKIDKK